MPLGRLWNQMLLLGAVGQLQACIAIHFCNFWFILMKTLIRVGKVISEAPQSINVLRLAVGGRQWVECM